MRERKHLEDLGVDVRVILKYILQNKDGRGWIGVNWLSTKTSGRLL